MRYFRVILAATALFSIAPLSGAETYGNFTTMGVVVDCPAGKKPADIARVKVFLVEDGARRPVQDAVQVASFPYFATSLFFLKPGSQYAVEVEFCAADGAVIAKTAEKGRTRPDPVLPAASKTLYVAPSGTDENPGTIEKPLKTLKAAFAKISPGTTLFIREGTYYEGQLVPAAGGTAEAPIVIRNYSGERVVIDAADPSIISDAWHPEANGVFSAPFKGSTWNVSAEDKATGKNYRLYPLRTLKELNDRKSARMTFDQLGFTGAYHCDGKIIHVVPPQGDMAGYRVNAARYTEGIILEGRKHVFIDGLEFRHFGQGECGSAVKLLDSSENVIQNCKVYYCNSGVWVKGDSFNNTIQDSTFVDDTNHWHFTYAKTEQGWSYHGQIETGAVALDAVYNGRGLVFRRNRVDGTFDGSRVSPWENVRARTHETDWYENTLVNIADDFVETDGNSRNVRIFDNYMDKSLSGISLAQALDGPTWLLYNVIANCGVCFATTNPADYPYEGYPFKTNGGPEPETGSGPVFFYHNTAWTSDPKGRAMLIKSQAVWKKFTFRNNIWCGQAMGFDSWQRSLSYMDWDYDDLYSPVGPFFRQSGDRECKTLADFQAAFKTMMHGVSADPRFTNPESGDFHLSAGSPCIDKGVVIDGINEARTKGAAPDVGVYEAQ